MSEKQKRNRFATQLREMAKELEMAMPDHQDGQQDNESRIDPHEDRAASRSERPSEVPIAMDRMDLKKPKLCFDSERQAEMYFARRRLLRLSDRVQNHDDRESPHSLEKDSGEGED